MFAVVFTVVMLCFSDIISIIEDREHLTSLISLSEAPHEIKGLAKVNKDICHIEISLCHHHQSDAFYFNTRQWKDWKRRKSPIKAEKTGLYLYLLKGKKIKINLYIISIIISEGRKKPKWFRNNIA